MVHQQNCENDRQNPRARGVSTRALQIATPCGRNVILEMQSADWPISTMVMQQQVLTQPRPQSSADETLISEIMNSPSLHATSDMTTDEVAALLLDEGVSDAPVIDDTGRPVGFVSTADVLRSMREPESVDEDSANDRNRDATAVTDVMMPVVCWLSESASVAQAAALMAYERVQTLAIVNAGGRLIGVIHYADLLAWLARRCGYLIPA